MKVKIENGTYWVTDVALVPTNKIRRCPVCSSGPRAGDGDMTLYKVAAVGDAFNADSEEYYFCASPGCGFCYPGNLEEKEVHSLIQERKDFLREQLEKNPRLFSGEYW